MSSKRLSNKRKNYSQWTASSDNQKKENYTMLDTLSNIANSYESLETASINDIIKSSQNKNIDSEKNSDSNFTNPTQNMDNSTKKAEKNNGPQLVALSNTGINLSSSTVSNENKPRAFFSALQQHYGKKYQQVTTSFVDTLKRFLKAEISEMALLSVLRYLFSDYPFLLNQFEELTHMSSFLIDDITNNAPVFLNDLSKQTDDTTSSLNNNYDLTVNVTSSPKSNDTTINTGIARNSINKEMDRSTVKEAAAAILLKSLKNALDPIDYMKFIDVMAELRTLVKLNNPPKTLIKKLRQGRQIISSVRDELKKQFDEYFPISESQSIDNQQSYGLKLPNGITAMEYAKFPYYPLPGQEMQQSLGEINPIFMYGNNQNAIMAQMHAEMYDRAMREGYQHGLYPPPLAMMPISNYSDVINVNSNSAYKRKIDNVNDNTKKVTLSPPTMNELYPSSLSQESKVADAWDGLIRSNSAISKNKIISSRKNSINSVFQPPKVGLLNDPSMFQPPKIGLLNDNSFYGGNGYNNVSMRQSQPPPANMNYNMLSRYYNQPLENYMPSNYHQYQPMSYFNAMVPHSSQSNSLNNSRNDGKSITSNK